MSTESDQKDFEDFTDRVSRNILQMAQTEKRNPLIIIPMLQIITECFAVTYAKQHPAILQQYLDGLLNHGLRAGEMWPGKFRMKQEEVDTVPVPEVDNGDATA